MKRIFRMAIKSLGAFMMLLVIGVVTCVIIGVTLDLSFLRPGIETSAGMALGRKVKIDGPVVFEFSTWPAIEARDVKVENVPGASKPAFIKAGKARLKIALFPLLKKRIRIAEVVAENVSLNIENDVRGRPNWILEKNGYRENGNEKEKVTGTNGKKTSPTQKRTVSFQSLDHLSLKNIEVHYRDAALGKSVNFHLEEVAGGAPAGKPMLLKIKGNLDNHGYSLELDGSPVEDLLIVEKPWAFTLEGRVAGKHIRAKGDMVVRNHRPLVNLAFGIKDVNVGTILSRLGLVEGLDASVGDAAFKLSLNGTSLKEVLRESSMIFGVRDGSWKITLPNTNIIVDISDLSGTIRVKKGKAVTVDLRGKIDQTPVELKITGSPLVQYVSAPKEIPLSLKAKISNTSLEFASKLTLPVSSKNLNLSLKITGDRLDDLDDLLKLDLPRIGPIFLDTRLFINNSGYNLSSLKVRVGKSSLNGKMKLDTGGSKPKLDINLISDLIRWEDFDTGGTKNRKRAKKTKEVEKTVQPENPEDLHGKMAATNRRSLLSYEVLNKLNASVRLEARQVTSGKDRLGSASVRMALRDARLTIDPIHVNIPGGDVLIKFSYEPSPTSATIGLKVNIDRFDFGIIARHAKPDTNMGGLFSLKAELNSTAPDLEQMMKYASGHLDFMLAPENFSAGIIDLWAVNLISAIINKTSEKNKSRINCLVVRLKMKDGLMKEKAIYMDTTKMRIAGKARINFKTRDLDILLVPKAKKPEFFSLATPIKVHGTFDDFGIGIGISRLAGTVISFVTSPIHVPIRRIFSRKVAADGYDACMAAWTLSDSDKKEKRKTE